MTSVRAAARRLVPLLGACLLVAALEIAPAAAKSEVFTPRFVTQTDTAVWDDCTWAAGVMLVSELTGGARHPTWRALRQASGDAIGGSNLRDLARGSRRLLGMSLRYSPDGGDPMTWAQLLDRLRYGGGAELQGGYSALPDHYTRWSKSTRAKSFRDSGHAVFVRTYDAANDRIWLMDPLGRGDYRGEWIPARVLKRFAYFDGAGRVYAASTPYVPSAYSIGTPALDGRLVVDGRVSLQLPIADTVGRPIPQRLRLSLDWRPTSYDPAPVAPLPVDALSSGVASPASTTSGSITRPATGSTVPRSPVTRAPAGPSNVPAQKRTGKPAAPPVRILRTVHRTVATQLLDGLLLANTTLPSIGGTYQLTIRVADRTSALFPSASQALVAQLTVHVAGRFVADVTVGPVTGVAGSVVTVPFLVSNAGARDWRPTTAEVAAAALAGPAPAPAHVAVVAAWAPIALAAPIDAPADSTRRESRPATPPSPAAPAAAIPLMPEATISDAPIASGAAAPVTVTVTMPAVPGVYILLVRVVVQTGTDPVPGSTFQWRAVAVSVTPAPVTSGHV